MTNISEVTVIVLVSFNVIVWDFCSFFSKKEITELASYHITEYA